jgi:leucyl-tRNA synthetase
MNALAKLESTDEVTRSVRQEVLQNVVLLLSPIVPHICQAIWAELNITNQLGQQSHILDAGWPVADKSAMVQDSVEYVIQVNGKLRGSITVAKTETKEALEKLALQQPFVQKFIEENMAIRKIIVVPNKLINVVVG